MPVNGLTKKCLSSGLLGRGHVACGVCGVRQVHSCGLRRQKAGGGEGRWEGRRRAIEAVERRYMNRKLLWLKWPARCECLAGCIGSKTCPNCQGHRC